jgi:4-hydroxy-3-methylbut-2-enyl diphosphate reductase
VTSGSLRHAWELELRKSQPGDKIRITAGASTPPAILKEAIHFMSDLEQEPLQPEARSEAWAGDLAQPEAQQEPVTQPAQPAQPQALAPKPPVPPPAQGQSFAEMLNDAIVTLHTGDIVKGTVIHVTSTEVTVNLGYKSDGIITRAEMTDDPAADITQLVKPGDAIDVYVLHVNDGDGNVLVSKKRLDAQTHYKIIEQAFTEKTPIAGKVTEVVKGGLIALIQGCRVFVPSSQISNRYVEDLTAFKGRELNFNILEFDRSKRRIVAGRKELATKEQQQRREELFGSLEIGQRLEGTVSRIVEFGAFVDLGGVDGLIHISELAWRRVKKVTDVLQAGEQVSVTVIAIDQEKNKISLSLKDINSNPWNGIAEKYPLGAIVEGKVVRMTSFGAFVTLEDGVDGLVHVSQITERHVAKPEDELAIGQAIQVKVTDVDEENHKISLSKREADAELYPFEIEEAEPEETDITDEPEVETAAEVSGDETEAVSAAEAPEPVNEPEPIKEPETAEEPEPAEESKPAEEPEAAKEPETAKELETIKRPEPVTEPEPSKEPEAVKEPKPARKPSTRKTKATDTPKTEAKAAKDEPKADEPETAKE